MADPYKLPTPTDMLTLELDYEGVEGGGYLDYREHVNEPVLVKVKSYEVKSGKNDSQYLSWVFAGVLGTDEGKIVFKNSFFTSPNNMWTTKQVTDALQVPPDPKTSKVKISPAVVLGRMCLVWLGENEYTNAEGVVVKGTQVTKLAPVPQEMLAELQGSELVGAKK